ncbi:MFS transporter [Pseudofrankia inefficax]|uniref:MFS transporter n=1 Tax=Pseudofrankia inefficax (strain DSM 45817 / CECT 9037 / DDB 130130 / EuI1c) TaxID=298654 RepID=UPI0001BFBA74|nr:MFS transporter [Pseudofrankia inefficax]
MPFYPVYALVFADAGVSPAGISALFALWSAASFLVEIPSGVWADVVSRRLLVILAPLLEAAGYALWIIVPEFWSFAAGFVLLGAGTALRSGTLQALVYAELDRIGAAGAYARLSGRAQAFGGAAELFATALAAPLIAAGGNRLVGVCSVLALLACAAAGRALPGTPRRGTCGPAEPAPDGQGSDDQGAGDGERGQLATLRTGLGVVRRSAVVRRVLLLTATLTGVAALDEYLPLLARGTGAGQGLVPLLVLAVTAGSTVGGLLAGRGVRWLGPALAAAAVLLAVGAGTGLPVGIVGVAAAFGIFYWALAQADARLQDRVDDSVRATVSSISGAAMEAVAILTFGLYAAGSAWLSPRWLFAAAALPCLLLAVAAGRPPIGRPGPDR